MQTEAIKLITSPTATYLVEDITLTGDSCDQIRDFCPLIGKKKQTNLMGEVNKLVNSITLPHSKC